jgi:hypothetical protein
MPPGGLYRRCCRLQDGAEFVPVCSPLLFSSSKTSHPCRVSDGPQLHRAGPPTVHVVTPNRLYAVIARESERGLEHASPPCRLLDDLLHASDRKAFAPETRRYRNGVDESTAAGEWTASNILQSLGCSNHTELKSFWWDPHLLLGSELCGQGYTRRSEHSIISGICSPPLCLDSFPSTKHLQNEMGVDCTTGRSHRAPVEKRHIPHAFANDSEVEHGDNGLERRVSQLGERCFLQGYLTRYHRLRRFSCCSSRRLLPSSLSPSSLSSSTMFLLERNSGEVGRIEPSWRGNFFGMRKRTTLVVVASTRRSRFLVAGARCPASARKLFTFSVPMDSDKQGVTFRQRWAGGSGPGGDGGSADLVGGRQATPGPLATPPDGVVPNSRQYDPSLRGSV